MEKALSGVKVLEFGHYIAGPYAAMLLAEQGAEVVKIERPQGDPGRSLEGWIVWNRSKRGITLDLKKEQARKVARELVKEADVVIENFRPGVAESLGIGYETVSALRPEAVYCSISGFGQTGPYSTVPGWEPIVSSLAGLYGEQAGEGNPPVYVVLPLASYYAALLSAFAITTALFRRQATGSGERLDMSLYASVLFAHNTFLPEFEGRQKVPGSDPQGGPALFRLYRGSDDKWFLLGAGNFVFCAKLAVALGHEEWLLDLFEGAPWLMPRNKEAKAILTEIFATKTAAEWFDFLGANDIPCELPAPIHDFLDYPQVVANDLVVRVTDPHVGDAREMGLPVGLSSTTGRIWGPSPTLGQHTQQVLSGLGYSNVEIAKLKSEGVL